MVTNLYYKCCCSDLIQVKVVSLYRWFIFMTTFLWHPDDMRSWQRLVELPNPVFTQLPGLLKHHPPRCHRCYFWLWQKVLAQHSNALICKQHQTFSRGTDAGVRRQSKQRMNSGSDLLGLSPALLYVSTAALTWCLFWCLLLVNISAVLDACSPELILYLSPSL